MKNLKKILVTILTLTGIMPAAGAELGNEKASSPVPEWLDSAVIYEANLRQGTPTRDLRGLQLQLPRLRDLGVDVIWLMPIHPIGEKERKGTLGSYYAVRTYREVNPEFGTMDDLKEFVRTAHTLGMKVILDEVCNHTGVDNVWVSDHPEYYHLNEKGEMHGIYDWTDVLKLDYSKPETRRAMTEALKFWIEEADIDGYRCDVAGEVPTDYWEEAREELQKVKPVLMLAEAAKPELLLKAFDVDYAWPMKDVFNAIAKTKGVNKWAESHNEKRPEMTAADIPALLERQKKEYPAGSIHMNMITNHDLNSWEGTEFDRYGEATGAFAILSYTLPGVPMMYTGQETGFNHAFEFFEADSVVPSTEANEFTAFYTLLNTLKHNNRALDARQPEGSIEFIKSDNPDILTYERINGENRVTVIVNLSGEEADVKYNKEPEVKGLTDIFTGNEAELPTKLKGWEYRVYAK